MSAALQNAHHLKVRMGELEFEASGERDTVNAQYALFLEAFRADGVSKPPLKNGNNAHVKGAGESDGLVGAWSRFYKFEGDSHLSMKVLPSTGEQNADTIILLLYGYLHLRKADTVGSTELLAMAKKSGLRIDRIDRNIPLSFNRYIGRAGSRRGMRYSLNNQGQAYAQQLLDTEAER